LVSENLSSGYKSVIWDGRNDEGKEVASGVYFYQLKTGESSEHRKMLLLK
jgi:flagellar hook assembly protein FlgD